MRSQRGKPGMDDPPFPFPNLVHGRLHVVVNAAARNASEHGKGPRVRVEEHFVPLTRVGHQDKGPTGAQLEVGHLNTPIDAANHQPFFAPVKLEGFAQGKFEGHAGRLADRLPRLRTPAPDKFSDPAVTPRISLLTQFLPEFQYRAPIPLGPPCIRFQRRRQPVLLRRQLPHSPIPPVSRLLSFRRFQPSLHRVPRQARSPRYLAQAQLVP
jgi:hypothetical protein